MLDEGTDNAFGKQDMEHPLNEALESNLASGATDEDEEITAYYENQPKIYQQLVPMEQVVIETEAGAYSGYLLTGVFVIGGRLAGILPRVGEKVTGDMAYYCAATVRERMNDEEEKEWKTWD